MTKSVQETAILLKETCKYCIKHEHGVCHETGKFTNLNYYCGSFETINESKDSEKNEETERYIGSSVGYC
jgi:hypothetical protein